MACAGMVSCKTMMVTMMAMTPSLKASIRLVLIFALDMDSILVENRRMECEAPPHALRVITMLMGRTEP